ncbi:stage II sporulation protein R [Bacillus sp. REN10]|uniref:stage II sporulation protein R n=1 Tax=Bacillus sp. REN10 TaxID=2782541 RepID=UPI00193C6CBD|nr:stage II sporulation protein R [Bacillus sp. REN10]
MNKLVAGLYLFTLSIATIISLYIPEQAAQADEPVIIPKEAIRLRILANSDQAKDQQLKRRIRDDVNQEITKWVAHIDSLPKARQLLKEKLPEIQEIALKRARKEGSTEAIKVEFGQAKFPTKLYGNFLYPAGEYEAIIITIGEGQGANWWCVLYPPLCFVDFSNGMAVSPGVEEPIEAEKEKKPSVKKEAEEEPEMKQEEKEAPVYAEGEEETPKIKFMLVEMFKDKK